MRVQTSYFICTTARTGSTLLCEALRNTGLAGRPEEYFTQPLKRYFSKVWGLSHLTHGDYLRRVIEENTTSNGVFGAKIMEGHFEDFLGGLRQILNDDKLPRRELMSNVFPNLHYIWITRRDKVRQAISLLRAMQTGVWTLAKGEQVKPAKEPHFDFQTIDYFLQGIVISEASWQQYFTECGITPFTVVYEDFISCEDTALNILHYLRVPVPDRLSFAERRLQKQADALSEEWYERYHQIKDEWFAQHKPPPEELPGGFGNV